jgi:hypothetical protein
MKISFRTLNLAINCLKKKSVAVSPLSANVSMDFSHLLKYSTTTMIYQFPLDETGWNIMKSTPHFVKGPMVITEKHGSMVHTHIFSKYLTGMTLLDHFDAIFKYRRLEITNA